MTTITVAAQKILSILSIGLKTAGQSAKEQGFEKEADLLEQGATSLDAYNETLANDPSKALLTIGGILVAVAASFAFVGLGGEAAALALGGRLALSIGVRPIIGRIVLPVLADWFSTEAVTTTYNGLMTGLADSLTTVLGGFNIPSGATFNPNTLSTSDFNKIFNNTPNAIFGSDINTFISSPDITQFFSNPSGITIQTDNGLLCSHNNWRFNFDSIERC